jgi:hypothetical protein
MMTQCGAAHGPPQIYSSQVNHVLVPSMNHATMPLPGDALGIGLHSTPALADLQ